MISKWPPPSGTTPRRVTSALPWWTETSVIVVATAVASPRGGGGGEKESSAGRRMARDAWKQWNAIPMAASPFGRGPAAERRRDERGIFAVNAARRGAFGREGRSWTGLAPGRSRRVPDDCDLERRNYRGDLSFFAASSRESPSFWTSAASRFLRVESTIFTKWAISSSSAG